MNPFLKDLQPQQLRHFVLCFAFKYSFEMHLVMIKNIRVILSVLANQTLQIFCVTHNKMQCTALISVAIL